MTSVIVISVFKITPDLRYYTTASSLVGGSFHGTQVPSRPVPDLLDHMGGGGGALPDRVRVPKGQPLV